MTKLILMEVLEEIMLQAPSDTGPAATNTPDWKSSQGGSGGMDSGGVNNGLASGTDTKDVAQTYVKPDVHIILLGPNQDQDIGRVGQARDDSDTREEMQKAGISVNVYDGVTLGKALNIEIQDKKTTLMSVTHTPLLGPNRTEYGGQARQAVAGELQRAGANTLSGTAEQT